MFTISPSAYTLVTTELTTKQKEALYQIILFIEEFGISITLVAKATGISRPSLANKIIVLKADFEKKEVQIRNKFTQEDFQKLRDFLHDFEISLNAYRSRVEKLIS